MLYLYCHHATDLSTLLNLSTMVDLPFLPGNTFIDPSRNRFHLSHTLGLKDGYQVAKPYPEVGIGGTPLKVNQLTEAELDELANFRPILTYGKSKSEPSNEFIPAHLALDKKVLRFFGYFKETVNESAQEHYRVRYVTIYYYIEDDTICIVEPPRVNSGLPQGKTFWLQLLNFYLGKILRRQRVPKNANGDIWNWNDINLGMNLPVYGRVYRITNCDKFTKDYLESEGIEVNEPEQEPQDPYLAERQVREALKTYKTPSSFDARRQQLELDRKVLRFYAVCDEGGEMSNEMRKITIHYYLCDDTMELREMHQPNDGRDPFPVLVRREKMAKDRFNVPSSFPSISMELTSNFLKLLLP
ncbi:unnamed protein product [Protopolystoma xenopodis]|uniref:DM10 domain-containing protein n=1 Tax=Protopolystoma xenopodis TaxID=117903 RepID=A0A448WVG0_9PLAT|nr:unnamed protein product [Protopolystoma xenopodis]